MWSILAETNLHRFFIVCLYTCALPLEIQLSRVEGWDPYNWFNPTTFVCLSQSTTFLILIELRWAVNFKNFCNVHNDQVRLYVFVVTVSKCQMIQDSHDMQALKPCWKSHKMLLTVALYYLQLCYIILQWIHVTDISPHSLLQYFCNLCLILKTMYIFSCIVFSSTY